MKNKSCLVNICLINVLTMSFAYRRVIMRLTFGEKFENHIVSHTKNGHQFPFFPYYSVIYYILYSM